MTRLEAEAYRAKIETAAASQTDEAALESIELFPKWKPEIYVRVKERYQYDSKLWKVDQSHTTQLGWEPDKVPALFTLVSLEEWPDFVQPTGSQDAYNRGDKITFEGQHYVSLINNNTWSPSDYPAGWQLN